MWALLIILYIQQGLDVQIVNVRFQDRDNLMTYEQCHTLEAVETKVLPLEVGNDARWQWATCIQVR